MPSGQLQPETAPLERFNSQFQHFQDDAPASCLAPDIFLAHVFTTFLSPKSTIPDPLVPAKAGIPSLLPNTASFLRCSSLRRSRFLPDFSRSILFSSFQILFFLLLMPLYPTSCLASVLWLSCPCTRLTR